MDTLCPWDGFPPGTVRFCEDRLCAWVVEPASTWSSLGYVIVGLFLLMTASRGRDGVFDARLVVVAIAEVTIGVGSLAFHGTGTLAGEFIDQVGMFMLSCLILSFAWGHARGAAPRVVAIVYGAAVGASMFVLWLVPPIGIPLFGLQLATGLGWEVVHRRSAADPTVYQNLIRGIQVFVVAFLIWLTDITGLVCDPNNHIITGHAVWHLLNAVSIERLFRFYRRRAFDGKTRLT